VLKSALEGKLRSTSREFRVPQISLLYSQEPVMGLHIELNELSPQ